MKGKIKLPNCDLLEVYRDSDINRIKNTIDNDWSIFVDEIKDSKIGGEIVFTDEDTYNLIEVDSTASTETKTNVISLLNEKG